MCHKKPSRLKHGNNIVPYSFVSSVSYMKTLFKNKNHFIRHIVHCFLSFGKKLNDKVRVGTLF